MRKTALALALSLAALAPVAAHAANTKTHARSRIVGHAAVAQWDWTSGNVATHVSVVVTDQDEDYSGARDEFAFVALGIDQYDLVTGNVLLTGVAYVDGPQNFDFSVDKDLGTAALHVRNAIFQDDNSFTFFNVDMDLNWAATADAFMSKSNTNFKAPGYHEVSHFKGYFRDGEATGSIFGKNTQFVSGTSSSAQLQQNQFGDITITTDTP